MSGDELFDHIRSLEMRLLDRDVRSRRAALEGVLDPDFVECGSSGRSFDREQVIELLLGEASRSFEIFAFATRRIAGDVVLATYRVEATAPGEPGRASLRSSLWRRDAAGWRMVFHQGTPVG